MNEIEMTIETVAHYLAMQQQYSPSDLLGRMPFNRTKCRNFIRKHQAEIETRIGRKLSISRSEYQAAGNPYRAGGQWATTTNAILVLHRKQLNTRKRTMTTESEMLRSVVEVLRAKLAVAVLSNPDTTAHAEGICLFNQMVLSGIPGSVARELLKLAIA